MAPVMNTVLAPMSGWGGAWDWASGHAAYLDPVHDVGLLWGAAKNDAGKAASAAVLPAYAGVSRSYSLR